MDRDETELVEACRRLLAEHGPASPDELAEQVPSDDPFLLEALLEEEPWAYWLPDGRVADLTVLLDGVVVTRRMSERELAAGVVALEPDLTLLLQATDVDERVPLAAGGDATAAIAGEEDSGLADDDPLAGEWVLTGPPGWLDSLRADELAAFRLAGGRLHVQPAGGALGDAAAAMVALAAAFEAFGEQGLVESVDVQTVALAEAPGLLARPLAPLSELLAGSDLEVRGEWMGPAGTDWEDAEESRELQALYGLDADGAEGLRLAVGAYGLTHREGLAHVGQAPEVLHALAHALSYPGVAEAFVSTTLGTGGEDAEDPERVAAFAAAVAPACDDMAGAHVVLACCAEQRGDALAAEAHLADALRADPDDATALAEAAWYAEDRGDAARALAYLDRAGDDLADEELELLERYAAPGPARASRNAPCPCGSGRKHKLCCGPRNGHPLADRVAWLYRKARGYLLRPAQRMRLTDLAVARAGGDPDTVAWVDAALHDPLVCDLALFEEGGMADFLAARGVLLPADELALGRDWLSRGRRSLFEVTDVRPAAGLGLRDVRTGDRFEVREQTASTQLQPGELLYTRVVPDGTGWQLLAPMLIPFSLRDRLLAFLDTDPDPAEVCAWFGAAEAPPTLTTMEGEPIVLCEGRWRVGDRPTAEQALAAVLERHAGEFVELADVGARRVRRGSARFDGPDLVIEATSEARFERLQATVAAALPGAEPLGETRTPVEQALAAHRRAAGGAPPATVELPAEVRKLVEQQVTAWEEAWVDEPIPALGGATPRQAAGDPTRRADLERLLDEYGPPPVEGPWFAMDPQRLRRLLGLT